MNEDEKVNPFSLPIKNMVEKIRHIPWGMPFLPQAIQFLVQSFILFVFCILYCTIGIVFNCYAVFCGLFKETLKEIQNGEADNSKSDNLVGKSAYALMAGIYLLLAAPCCVVITPFMLLGWLWKRMSWRGLVLYCFILGTVVVVIVFKYNPISCIDWFTDNFAKIFQCK